jgi:hypothetical protein
MISTIRRVGAAVAMAIGIGVRAVPTATPAGAGSTLPPGPSVKPATGGNGAPVLASTIFPLDELGYSEAEFIVQGDAESYTATVPLGTDGKWSARPATEAAYGTRIVVRRPTDPTRFNGTVFVEWLNVSGGLDAAPDWIMAHNEIMRRGAVWVGVSAQAVGLNTTKSADPVRYADLVHPGDSYSYDIYSQVGRVVRSRANLVLDGLRPRRVIAVGESQSAIRMVTYIDAVHPLVRVYDGFLVHSRFANGAPLSQSPLTQITTPTPSNIRDDLDEPVLVVETETDIIGSNVDARQPDSANLRLWEIAGTAHADYYTVGPGFIDRGDGAGAAAMVDALLHPTSAPLPGIIECDRPINSGAQHWVVQAGFRRLDQWVRGAPAPNPAPRLEVVSRNPTVLARDAAGNALGGVRTPQVDVPVAALSGTGQSGSGFCGLFGTTTPFSAAQIAARYPNHRAFVRQWRAAAIATRDAGYLTFNDTRELVVAATQSDIAR